MKWVRIGGNERVNYEPKKKTGGFQKYVRGWGVVPVSKVLI